MIPEKIFLLDKEGKTDQKSFSLLLSLSVVNIDTSENLTTKISENDSPTIWPRKGKISIMPLFLRSVYFVKWFQYKDKLEWYGKKLPSPDKWDEICWSLRRWCLNLIDEWVEEDSASCLFTFLCRLLIDRMFLTFNLLKFINVFFCGYQFCILFLKFFPFLPSKSFMYSLFLTFRSWKH